MIKIPTHKTHGHIIQRVQKSDTNIYGVKHVKTIPNINPCVVIFGGELTVTEKDANYYASLIEKLISSYGISGVDIYSVYYDFEELSSDRKTERMNAFINACSKLLKKHGMQQHVDTTYIDELYRTIIHPRIVNNDGKRISDADALKNVQNIMFFTHCHGSVPVRAFQEKMTEDMRNLGYENSTIRSIMKNILVIQHAPVSPLENSKFNTISFMSANDTQMNFHNKFSEYITNHCEDLFPSYFSRGKLFAVYGFTPRLDNEHQIIGIVPNTDEHNLTPDGAIIMAAERNAIINGVQSIKKHAKTPSVRNLIAPASLTDAIKPDFDMLKQNGEFFMQIMTNDLQFNRTKER